MKKLAFLLCLVSSFTFLSLHAAEAKENESTYKPKDYSRLIGMPGFSDEALKMHFKLYQGYVTNTNMLLGLIKQYAAEGKDKTAPYAEIKRRVMWEFDGMRLHEDYFSNLGGKGTSLEGDSPLYRQIVQDFTSFEKWKSDFMATGAMRGIGWAVLVFDPVSKRLFNNWINEHDRGHLAGGEPILIMDVFEHAYLLDYGLDRGKYIQSFFDNIDWNVVSKRFSEQKEQENKADET
ncbi:MAG: Superoxide dismutase [Fe] [Chlamydiae bacterium]|nr:Superoxide dismutase [Fe] [Chlamydiota bacterium]